MTERSDPEYVLDAQIDFDPIDYPGRVPGVSGILTERAFLPLHIGPGEGAPAARIATGDGGRRLDDLLYDAGAAGLDERALVVAVGANGDPSIMYRKLVSREVSPLFPHVKCTVENLAVGHSAHVAGRGYVPAAPYHSTGSVTPLFASWFDDEQLRALDDTEPNYRRVELSGRHYPLALATGEAPASYFVYATEWGLLTDREAYVPLMSQHDIHEFLLRHADVMAELPEVDAVGMVEALAAEDAIATLPHVFHRSQLAQPSRLVTSSGPPDTRYRHR
ncbi:MAG: hypothetical protein ACRDO8_00160 [Nocardioidaceae bacterium]